MGLTHTPTPWRVNGTWTTEIYADGYYVGTTTGSDIKKEQNEVNAAHIVLCVNAWDDAAMLRARLAELEAA